MNLENNLKVSAPCNFTLFGYPYSMYQGTAVAIALDIRIASRAEIGKRFTINGDELDSKKHRYVRAALIHGWSDIDTPVTLEVDPKTPMDNELGYKSSYIVSMLGALSMLNHHLIYEDIAKRSYNVISEVQGNDGPINTSVATHGTGVVSMKTRGENFLWSIGNGRTNWHIHHLDIPEMCFVMALTGEDNPASDIILNRIQNFVAKQKSFAKDIFREAGLVADNGVNALKKGDIKGVGKQMDEMDKLSAILGVYTPELKRLATLCRRYSHGIVICDAIEQGCIAALTDRPDELAGAIKDEGAFSIITKTSNRGVEA